MKCFPRLTAKDDRAFWVTKCMFDQQFDKVDFRCREALDFESNYSCHWFESDQEGNCFFLLPTVQVVSGSTQFINGRHRTAVVLDKCDRIPMAFAGCAAIDLAMQRQLKPVRESIHFELPDLPIVDRPRC